MVKITCDCISQCAQANPCYEADKCENRVPGYQCAACPDGYRGNAPSGVGLEDAQNSKQECQEIDECKEGISTCDPNAQCTNTNVSFCFFFCLAIRVIAYTCTLNLHEVFTVC